MPRQFLTVSELINVQASRFRNFMHILGALEPIRKVVESGEAVVTRYLVPVIEEGTIGGHGFTVSQRPDGWRMGVD
jgi:hypothetical protein